MAKPTNNTRPGVGVTKKEGESVGSLSRRFVQKVRGSGILMEKRSRQFHKPGPNKRARRESALVRAERRKEYAKLRKWGKVK